MSDTRLYRHGIIAPPILAAFGHAPPTPTPNNNGLNNGHNNNGNGLRMTHELMQLSWGFLTRWPTQADVAESAIGLLRALLSGVYG